MNETAQTIQSTGMTSWSVKDWGLFFTFLAGFIAGSVIPMMKLYYGNKRARIMAELALSQNKTLARGLSPLIDINQGDRSTPDVCSDVSQDVREIAKQTPPPPVIQP